MANSNENEKNDFIEIANKFGYHAEEFEVVTEDKYVLKIFHIPGDQNKPVFLQHGLYSSADDFILRGKDSIAIDLASMGYDIWAGNSRGNKYCRKHKTLNPEKDNKEFFKYSFHEFGVYDTPANIDFILKKTRQKSVSAIGHSEGTTMFFVMGSKLPKYNKKIKVFIALAPICYFNHIESPLSKLIDLTLLLDGICEILDQQEIPPKNETIMNLLKNVCSSPELGYDICMETFIFPLVGYDRDQLEPSFFATLVANHQHHFGTSRRNLMHYGQVKLRRKFSQYDYGKIGNLLHYFSLNPPDYNLKKIKMKIALISGKNDILASLEDANDLKKKLPNVVDHVILDPPNFNHVDFIFGRDTIKVLHPVFENILNEYN